jgi:hypothetical protein
MKLIKVGASLFLRICVEAYFRKMLKIEEKYQFSLIIDLQFEKTDRHEYVPLIEEYHLTFDEMRLSREDSLQLHWYFSGLLP